MSVEEGRVSCLSVTQQLSGVVSGLSATGRNRFVPGRFQTCS